MSAGRVHPRTLTLRHFEWLVASDEEQYVASCYHGQHYRQARESRRQDTLVLRPGILEREKMN